MNIFMGMYIDTIETSKAYKREDLKVPVIIVYRRPVVWTDRILKVACGEFTHCELYIPNIEGTFSTTVDCGMELRFDLKYHYNKTPHDYAWHLIVMSQTEYDRMCSWNMEQVSHHCKYNYSDLVWQLAPYMRSFVHDLTRQDASHPKKMFCSQAIVLALRAAFNGPDSSPHMRAFVASMNSRLTTPGCLLTNVSKYVGVDVSDSRVPLSVKDVNTCTDEAVKKQNKIAIYYSHY